jgi:tetratricopeptide (TPR) repeat protein
VVLPLTKEGACAYVDVLRTAPEGDTLTAPRATVFLSHAYDYKFLDAVDAVAAWETRNPLPDGARHFFYFDLLVVNQHGQDGVVPFEVLRDTFGGSVKDIGRTLFLLDYVNPISLGRAWCVFEAAVSLSSGCSFEVLLPPHDEAAFELALVEDFDSLVLKTCSVDVEKADAQEKSDEENIKRVMRKEQGGFLRVNQRVIGSLREWMAKMGRRALQCLNGDWETTALTNNLARLLKDQGKLSEAEHLYVEALSGRRRVLGNSHLDTLGTINNLANVLKARGKLSEAEPLCIEALAGRRRVLGDSHRDTLRSINNLASFMRDQGELSKAGPLYFEALAGRRRVLGDSHPDTLASTSNLANLLKDQGDFAEAEILLRDALSRVTSAPELSLALVHLLSLDAPERAFLIGAGRVLLSHAHALTNVGAKLYHVCDGCGSPRPRYSCVPCGFDLCEACHALTSHHIVAAGEMCV